jgi:hypothetical protein
MRPYFGAALPRDRSARLGATMIAGVNGPSMQFMSDENYSPDGGARRVHPADA